MKKQLATFLVVVTLGMSGLALALPSASVAQGQSKYFVCKYVGQPGVDESLQTGDNPISVAGPSINKDGVEIGYEFSDRHGRSVVIAEDTGQDKPECPKPVNEEPKDPVGEKPDEPEEEKEPEKDQPGDRIPVTGCPYGDSIPLGDECDKHKPVVEETTTTPVVREQTQIFQGK